MNFRHSLGCDTIVKQFKNCFTLQTKIGETKKFWCICLMKYYCWYFPTTTIHFPAFLSLFNFVDNDFICSNIESDLNKVELLTPNFKLFCQLRCISSQVRVRLFLGSLVGSIPLFLCLHFHKTVNY